MAQMIHDDESGVMREKLKTMEVKIVKALAPYNFSIYEEANNGPGKPFHLMGRVGRLLDKLDLENQKSG